jgi:RNA polymerase sigma-70 factor (ECF subfamily)
MVDDAAIDAILALISNPSNYSASKGELWSYLRRIAENKAADQLRQWYRRNSHEYSVAAITEIAERESLLNSTAVVAETRVMYSTDLPVEVTALVNSTLQSQEEQQVFALVCDGTRNLEEYAVVLGVSHLPLEERRREVKRVRDRVMKRLTRRRDEIARLLAEADS